MNSKFMKTPLATLVSFAMAQTIVGSNVLAQESTNAEEEKTGIEVVQIFGSRQSLDTATGSAALVDTEQLEQFEFDDIHRVLQSIPGVYAREEDGYGLRPNLGLRGATTERSSKVALMEDGVLLAPAPYAAPAAYFFPLVSRMTGVEVFKGPAAIAYGPNTVGGAINLLSRSAVSNPETEIDFAYGDDSYRKGHAFHVGQYGEFAVMVEGAHLASDGFKSLTNDSDTGFEKNEWITKVRYTPENAFGNQFWEVKFGFANEVSDETYLGLSDEDFAADPYQRYSASQDDHLDWEHFQYQLSHYIELSANTTLFTQVYRRDFERDWDRFNGFDTNRTIQSILNAPQTGLNTLFMEVLRGERDSLGSAETIVTTLNDREYYSQGVQTSITWDGNWGEFDVTIDSGFRIHQDQVERLHRDRFFLMQQGQLISAGQPDSVATDNKDEVTAIAGFVNTKIQQGDLHASVGLRVESIDGDATDTLTGSELFNSDTVVLPGVGVFYQMTPSIGLLAGINKGFVPNSPGQQGDIDPEESWNYELGLRGSSDGWRGELIGFFNDYSNLKGTCTFSSGCFGELDVEFNGGEVDVYGVEASLSGSIETSVGLSIPVSLAYTHTQSEFQTSFTSEFSQWGNVVVGDELPYLPENQLYLQVGLEGQNWRADLSYKYIADMVEAAGVDTELEGFRTDKQSVIDLSGLYQFSDALRLYAKLDNLTDEVDMVSRRPFGARSSKPRQFIVGAKYTF